jgi:hypothetical protein
MNSVVGEINGGKIDFKFPHGGISLEELLGGTISNKCVITTKTPYEPTTEAELKEFKEAIDKKRAATKYELEHGERVGLTVKQLAEYNKNAEAAGNQTIGIHGGEIYFMAGKNDIKDLDDMDLLKREVRFYRLLEQNDYIPYVYEDEKYHFSHSEMFKHGCGCVDCKKKKTSIYLKEKFDESNIESDDIPDTFEVEGRT